MSSWAWWCSCGGSSGRDVLDLPRVAVQRGWDKHELMHLVFEHREEEDDGGVVLGGQCQFGGLSGWGAAGAQSAGLG